MRDFIRELKCSPGKFKFLLAIGAVAFGAAMITLPGVAWYYTAVISALNNKHDVQLARAQQALTVAQAANKETLDDIVTRIEGITTELNAISKSLSAATDAAKDAAQTSDSAARTAKGAAVNAAKSAANTQIKVREVKTGKGVK